MGSVKVSFIYLNKLLIYICGYYTVERDVVPDDIFELSARMISGSNCSRNISLDRFLSIRYISIIVAFDIPLISFAICTV